MIGGEVKVTGPDGDTRSIRLVESQLPVGLTVHSQVVFHGPAAQNRSRNNWVSPWGARAEAFGNDIVQADEVASVFECCIRHSRSENVKLASYSVVMTGGSVSATLQLTDGTGQTWQSEATDINLAAAIARAATAGLLYHQGGSH